MIEPCSRRSTAAAATGRCAAPRPAVATSRHRSAERLERRFLELITEADLPYPVVNGYIGDLQVDFHWPDYKLVVETDGKATHGHAIAFHRDRDRDSSYRREAGA